MTITAQSATAAIRAAIKKADQERAAIDPRWSAQARREREAELTAALKGQVEKERDQGLQALEEARKAARAKRYKAGLSTGPATPAQWQEAAGRAPFVAQDLLAMPPEEIPLAYQAAQDARDVVGAWLFQRLGAQQLKDLLERKAGAALPDGKTAKALQDLRGMDPAAKAEQEYKAELKALDDLQAELWRAVVAGLPSEPAFGGVVRF